MTTTTREQVDRRINAALDAANGKRRERTMSRSQIDYMIEAIEEGCREWTAHVAGTVANAYKYRTSTTVAVAAKVEGRIYVGIGTCDAHAGSVGRTFRELQPWKPGKGPAGDAAKKWLAWSQNPDVFPID